MYGVVSWKSTHEKVVLMVTDLDCASKAPGVFPLVVYSAVMAFPDFVPLM